MISQLKSGVEGAQVGGHDGDEDEGHGRGLDQGVAVGPLDALQLGPAGGEEADDARRAGAPAALARACGAAPARLPALAALALLAAALVALSCPAAASLGRRSARRRRASGAGRTAPADASAESAAAVRSARRRRSPSPRRPRSTARLGDLAGAARDLGRAPAARLAASPVARPAQLCCSRRAVRPSAVPWSSPRLLAASGSPCGGVPAAPVAVLAHLDSVRRIAPRLVRLVVAALALLAGERHADSNFPGPCLSSLLALPSPSGHTRPTSSAATNAAAESTRRRTGRTKKNARLHARGLCEE